MRQEEWLSIPGYEGKYEASSWGRVRSMDRVVVNTLGFPKHRKSVILKVGWSHGYKYVFVCDLNKHLRRVKVARLVMWAFAGVAGTKTVIRHMDGNKANDCFWNLCYGTQQDNQEDMIRLGERHVGSQCWQSKLNEDQVGSIKMRIGRGESPLLIAKDYGVGRTVISHIKHGKSWLHVYPKKESL